MSSLMKLMNIKGPKTLPELLHSIKFVKPKLLNSATFTDLKPAFRGHAVYGNHLLASDACTCCRIALRPHVLNLRRQGKQEAQPMLTTGSTRLAVSRGQQTWYHSTCYI